MKSNRCLYNKSFNEFFSEPDSSILGNLADNYHGDLSSTQIDAWKEEVSILKNCLSFYKKENGHIIFEYDIPRLGKRIDVVLFFRGIIFCLEFKIGESSILESDVD